MNYKNLIAAAYAAAFVFIGGCSSDDSPSRTKIQFVNGTHGLGTIEFEANGVRHVLAPRAASPVVEVDSGPLTVTLRSEAGAAATRVLSIDETTAFLVSFGADRTLDVRSIAAGPEVPAGNTAVQYYGHSPESLGIDVYFVLPGTDIAAANPSNPAPLGALSTLSASFAPGTYEMVIAAAGKKTILFKSAPMELRAGQRLTLLGATRSSQVVTPQPIVLEPGAVRSLEDSRPAVRLLSDLMSGTGLQTLIVDGDVIAYLPSPSAASGSFHITPGTRMFEQIGSLPNGAHPQEILAGQSYTLRYRQDGFGTYPVAYVGWGFFPAIDYPVPAGKARIRLIVENVQRSNLVKVDGQLVSYTNQALGNAGLVIDRDPGPVSIEVFTPDTDLSEGIVNLSLGASHYYVVRFLSTTGHAGPLPYPEGGPPVQRHREVSSD
ncbi:hypothetical protein [Usitatibacter palustris]|uniref:DUF4397 domain-containing protein n=1 Tax=Usitatibacter palustris TaxID=2732487 RepID=A0A6M4H3Z5_9PROT|nr:hypothetical protein [Usitatibacter palustris]QJR14002.1 hypothetical protein DSM104440_00794 [Usitatibacter palustris]